MSDTAKRLHSVNFGNKNTWDDWGLIPIKRPVIVFPPVKDKTLDVPGADGEIDITDTLVGYPLYSNRKDSLQFRFIDNPDRQSAIKRRNKIASYLHGKKMNLILDEEPEYYYTGRFQLQGMEYKGKGDWADVEIAYNLEPYKYSIVSSLEDWLWDPFSFEDGVIMPSIFKDISIPSTNAWQYINGLNDIVGDMAVSPTVTANGDVQIRLYDSVSSAWGTIFTFNATTSENSDFVITYRHTRLAMRSTSNVTVSIDFRGGRL